MPRFNSKNLRKLVAAKPALLPEQAGLVVPTKSKYNTAAKEDRTYNGVVFDSKLELRMFKELIRLGIPEADIQRQVRYELIPKQTSPSGKAILPVNYVADFVIGPHVLDAKGMRLADYIIKRKAMLHIHKLWVIELKNLKDVAAFVESYRKTNQ